MLGRGAEQLMLPMEGYQLRLGTPGEPHSPDYARSQPAGTRGAGEQAQGNGEKRSSSRGPYQNSSFCPYTTQVNSLTSRFITKPQPPAALDHHTALIHSPSLQTRSANH